MKRFGSIVAVAIMLFAAVWFFGARNASPAAPKLRLPADPRDRTDLLRCAEQLRETSTAKHDPLEIVALIRLLNDGLPDPDWRTVQPAVLESWSRLHDVPAVWGDLLRLDGEILPRVARCGTIGDLERLIRLANTNSIDCGAINESLQRAASEELPQAGYAGSRQSEIVAAAVAARDSRRAKAYLTGLSWPPGASDELKAIAARVGAAIDASGHSHTGRFDAPAIVSAWAGVEEDTAGRATLRAALEEVITSAILAAEAKLDGPKAEVWLQQSAAEPGTDTFWDTVVTGLLPRAVEGHLARFATLEALTRAYATRFGKPDYGYVTWLRVAEEVDRISPRESLRTVAVLERAFEAAASDGARVATALRIADGYVEAADFQKALETLRKASDSVQDPAEKERLRPRLAEVEKKAAEDRERIAKLQKAIEDERRREHVQGMRNCLETARRYGRPENEIKNIENAIRELERQTPK